MGLAGNGGATGVAAAGSTATGVGAAAWVAAAVTCGADVAVAAEADLVTVKSRRTVDLAAGSGEVASRTLRAAATASARRWCTKGANALATDGAGWGDGVGSAGVITGERLGLVGAEASADGVEPEPDGPRVDGSDAPPEMLGDVVALDAVLDSAAVVGLVLLLPSEWRGAVLEPVTPAGGLPAFFGDREPWVGFVFCDDLVDGAMWDATDSCVVFDGPLEARSDEVCGPRFDAEPLLLLDAEGPLGCGPVLSAWATPDPPARAAPTPSAIAPAPSQP
jgi:hypothetical protein